MIKKGGVIIASFNHIFTPLKIGRMTVKNRIETAPAGAFLATMEGDVSRELIEWERALAKGGAGIVTIGDTPIINGQAGHSICLGTDKSINALNRLAETIQRYGAKASIELTHHVNSSPSDMTLEEINTLVESYANAAYRCMNAGMDMIMIHGAHGHLISQFFSAKRNHRSDAYGGTVTNRSRFVTDVLGAIRRKVGDNLAIEYRISADELVSDGLSLEEQLEFAKLIQDKIDLLHVSAGKLYAVETLPSMIQPTYVPRGINVHFAKLFKQELNIPVTTVGSLDLAMAEEIIVTNQADMVAMNRALIADPDCINKARKGLSNTIRPCVRCNTCIERTHKFHLAIRCAVNPQNGREAEYVNLPMPVKMKKVVVVGGGPAGMEAARTAADLGHQVVLIEKQDQLGGNLLLAAAAPFKEDMRKYLEWAISSTKHNPNVQVKLGTEATAEIVSTEHPDSLIIAVGSTPIVPNIPGVDRENVVWAGVVNCGKAKVGDSVILVGAGLTGSETALFLAQQGKKVTMIDMRPLAEIDAENPFINIFTLRSLISKHNIVTRAEVKLEAITDSGVIIIDQTGNICELPCDTVVLSLGVEPREEIVRTLETLAPEVYVVGDCNNLRGNLYSAIRDGFNAAIGL